MASTRVRIEAGSELAGDGKEIQEKSNAVSSEKAAMIGVFSHVAIAQAKKMVQFSVSNIGNFSGDYVMQRNVQQAMSIVGDIVSIGVGAAAGGVVGAVGAMTGVLINNMLESIGIAQNIKKENYQSNFIKERGGDVYNDGSRGTYD